MLVNFMGLSYPMKKPPGFCLNKQNPGGTVDDYLTRVERTRMCTGAMPG